MSLKLLQVVHDRVQRVLMECPVSSRENTLLCSSNASFIPALRASAGCYGDGLLVGAGWPGYTGVNRLNIPSPFKVLCSYVGCHFVS